MSEEFERIVSADADGAEEQRIEAALRPKLDDFVGQERVREQLSSSCRARCGAAGRPTTCCCPAGPASARPPSP